MDVKALAKSKRAHSSHHSKKPHHPRPAKAPSPAPETGKKVKEKPQQPRGSKALPSNWAQYDEQDDTDSEITSQGSIKKATDVVMPKSKGADYAYLISEAKAQTRTNFTSDEFSPFDEVLDVNLSTVIPIREKEKRNPPNEKGLAPLLTMRGQGILSWMEDDDDFDMKDEATGNYEAPFLSLDLKALAEQIAKANLTERLFIEPDLLPPEMYAEWQESKQNKFDEDKVRSDDEVPVIVSDEQTDIVKGNEVVCGHLDTKSSDAMASKKCAGGREDHVKDNDDEVAQTSQRNSSKSTAELDMVSVAKKTSKFEALTAEAELDMLLDSFSETKFFESSIGENMLQDVPSVEPVKKVPDMVQPPALAINFNDDIDELLKETSTSTSINIESAPPQVIAAAKDLLLDPDPASKSKLLDDFDSWLDTI